MSKETGESMSYKYDSVRYSMKYNLCLTIEIKILEIRQNIVIINQEIEATTLWFIFGRMVDHQMIYTYFSFFTFSCYFDTLATALCAWISI